MFKKANSGQAIIIIAFATIAMLAVMGLSIDGGRVLLLHRRTQGAADAAALAGIRALCRGDANYIAIAKEAAAENDFNNDGVTNSVSINVPPTDPNITIKTDCQGCYLEALVRGKIPGTFISMFYSGPLEATSRTVGICIPNVSGNDPGSIGLRAMWGISDTCNNTVDFTGSSAYISGGIHTNNDLHYGATGGGGTVIGPVSYAGDWKAPTAGKVDFLTGEYVPPAPPDETLAGLCKTSCFDSPSGAAEEQTCQAEAFPEHNPYHVCEKQKDPLSLNISDFAPGGAKASAAGDSYHAYTPASCTTGGFENWMAANGYIVNNVVQSGLYYSTCGIKLSSSEKGKALYGTATFVSTQDIQISGGVNLTAFVDDLMFFANGGGEGECSYNAVQVSGASNIWTGNIYAPHGQVQFSGASNNNIAQGCIVAFSINFSGSDNRIICNPTDPEFTPSPAISLAE